MKVLITGGRNEADFVIKMFKEEKNQIIVVNGDKDFCKYLSKENAKHVNYKKQKQEGIDQIYKYIEDKRRRNYWW